MTYGKKPCQHCPFRKDVRPFLHPRRAEEIASVAESRYGSFPCHKTTSFDGDDGEAYYTNKTKECAGMLTLRSFLDCKESDLPDGFVPAKNCYESVDEMVDAYTEEYKQ